MDLEIYTRDSPNFPSGFTGRRVASFQARQERDVQKRPRNAENHLRMFLAFHELLRLLGLGRSSQRRKLDEGGASEFGRLGAVLDASMQELTQRLLKRACVRRAESVTSDLGFAWARASLLRCGKSGGWVGVELILGSPSALLNEWACMSGV